MSIIIKFIPNPLEKEGRITKQIPYSRSKSIKDFVTEAGFDRKDKRIVVSGKRIEDLNRPIDNDDEILILPDVEDPVTAIGTIGTLLATGGAIWGAEIALWSTLGMIGALMTVGVSIYTALSEPKRPSRSTNSRGIDQSSPTYGWEGIQTIQEVDAPVPIIYGEHRVGGNIINAFIRTDGDQNYLNVLLGLCEGEIKDIDSIKLDDNPSENFDGITLYKRYGTNNQAVIPNFEDAHNLYSVNVQLTKNNPHIYTTVDSDVEGFEIHLKLPNGLFQQADSGAVQNWSVTYKVEYKVNGNGGWIDLGSTTITAKSRSTLRRVYRKTGLAAGKYDIRVTRTSDDSSLDPLKEGDLYWVQTDEIKTDDFAYPNTALLGIEALASEQLSGTMPNFTCIVKGKKVNIPKIMNGTEEVNWEDYYWDPNSEKYKLLSDDTELSWDGSTYVDKYSANPIWCIKDLLVNSRYGLGEFIVSSVLDSDLFLEMSRYCEEKISDGEGSYEKRFRLDVVLDSPVRALDLIVQLCAVFRGLPFDSEGAIKIRIDKPETPVQLFGMGNIIEDSFNQSWKSIREVPNVIEIQFMDKDKDYKQETITVIDEDALASGDPMRKRQMRVFTTKVSYAIREGRYALWIAKHINRSVAFKAGIDAIACQAGDLTAVSHDVPQWGFSGRVLTGTVDSVKLDQEVTIEDGKTYKVRVQFADDTIEERTVSNSPGTTDTLTVSSSFSQVPQNYDVYAFGESSKVVKPFRILSLQKDGRNEIAMTAIEYNENIYDDSDITIPDNNYSALDLTVPNVENLELTERLIKLADGTIENAIDVWFDKPTQGNYVRRFAKAKVYISENNQDWAFRGETTGRHFQIIGDIVDGQTYYVKVLTVTEDNEEGSFNSSPSSQITIVGKSAPPSDVSTFLVNQDRDRLLFGWTEVDDVDVWGYEIRWGENWDSGKFIAFIQGNRYLTTDFRTGTGQKFWIKALDTSGNYSENATQATITIDQIPFQNLVEEYSEQTAWSGTKNNTEKDGDNLKISAGYTEGTYTTPVRDVGYVATFGIKIDVIVSITQGLRFNSDDSLKFNSDETLRFTGTETPGAATFEIKTSEDNVEWSEWKTYQAGDYKCRYFQIRMTLKRSSVDVNLLCSTFNYCADLPDVDEFGDDEVTVAADGKAVIFEKTFHEEPAVNISIRSGDGIYYQFTAKDTTGFTVKLYDAGGVAKTGQFEFHAHGI